MLHIIRNPRYAFALQDAACYTGCNLLFTIVQVNAALQCTLWWIIRHKARLLINQPPHRLLIPQCKICFVADLLNRVCSIVAIQSINPRCRTVYVSNGHFMRVCVPLGYFIAQGFKTLSAPDLCQSPLLVSLLGDFARFDFRSHFCITLYKCCKISVYSVRQLFGRLLKLCRNAIFQRRKLLVRPLVSIIRFRHFRSAHLAW